VGLLELIIVILVLLWLLGYFGRGRLLGGATTGRGMPTVGGYDLVHVLLVIALVLLVVRLLR
jgi:hypothetical protein